MEPLDAFGQGALHLLPCQVDQQVGDAEHRVAGLVADAHLHLFPVLLHNDPVEGHGDGSPLVLLDAAVVVGLHQRQLALFVEGVGL
mgnify:CR=1 FL=1